MSTDQTPDQPDPWQVYGAPPASPTANPSGPWSAAPVSPPGQAYPSAVPPQPWTGGPPEPWTGGPPAAQPPELSSPPWPSMPPVSAPPTHVSSPPAGEGRQDWTHPPVWNGGPDPLLDNGGMERQPRITPSQRPRRSRLVPGLLIGLLLGAGAAGPTGYFLHSGKSSPKPKPSATPSLSVYEAQRLELNKAKFSGDLAKLAEPWLPYLGDCLSNLDGGGPQLAKDELVHITCTDGGVKVVFEVYQSAAARDAARAIHVEANSNATYLAPGLMAPGRRNGGVSKAPGNYIEYAYRNLSNEVVSGVWWDRDDDTSSLTIEAIYGRELGGKWDPLRDMWQHHS